MVLASYLFNSLTESLAEYIKLSLCSLRSHAYAKRAVCTFIAYAELSENSALLPL